MLKDFDSIKNKSVQDIENFLKAGFDVNGKDKDGNTLLQCAAMEGKKQIVDYLLQQKNIKVDIPDAFGQTALFYAIKHAKFEIALNLVEAGADVTILDKSKETILYFLARSYDYKTRALRFDLLKKILDVDKENFFLRKKNGGLKYVYSYLKYTWEGEERRFLSTYLLDHRADLAPRQHEFCAEYYKGQDPLVQTMINYPEEKVYQFFEEYNIPNYPWLRNKTIRSYKITYVEKMNNLLNKKELIVQMSLRTKKANSPSFEVSTSVLDNYFSKKEKTNSNNLSIKEI